MSTKMERFHALIERQSNEIAELKKKLAENSAGDIDAGIELVRLWLNDCTQDELRTLRAIINGKLGKRKITPEQQAKMQAARQKVI